MLQIGLLLEILLLKARYKKVTDTTYSSYTTLQDDVTQQFTLDNNYEWNVQVVLEDRIGTTTYNLVLNRGIPIAFFDRLKRSLGINCFPADQESLEVNDLNILDKILGTELYNNTTGSNNAITLSESASNFTYLEIFYRNNDYYYNSTKIYQPNGKIAYLDADYPYTSGECYSYTKKTSVQISGTSITPINYVELTIMPKGANIQNKNNIYITKSGAGRYAVSTNSANGASAIAIIPVTKGDKLYVEIYGNAAGSISNWTDMTFIEVVAI